MQLHNETAHQQGGACGLRYAEEGIRYAGLRFHYAAARHRYAAVRFRYVTAPDRYATECDRYVTARGRYAANWDRYATVRFRYVRHRATAFASGGDAVLSRPTVLLMRLEESN